MTQATSVFADGIRTHADLFTTGLFRDFSVDMAALTEELQAIEEKQKALHLEADCVRQAMRDRVNSFSKDVSAYLTSVADG